jgi:Coenzyme F420-dependent N5,N10-methylene tetrahydromethanopterin reductase and related flavin-dependent oxidoreductases
VAAQPGGRLEPTVLLTAVAAATERIGVIATCSSTYNEPFNLARRIASLDHISGGRAAWNVVTNAGDAAAQNFGLAGAPLHVDRYGRAEEFVDVTLEAMGQLGRRRDHRRPRCRPLRRPAQGSHPRFSRASTFRSRAR